VIHWLIQSITAHPKLIRGQAPSGLLNAEETAVFNGFSVLKRRQDWLLGRWTTKLLLQEIVRQQLGRVVPLAAIAILPGPDGAPRVTLSPTGIDLSLSFSVSISHSHGLGFCAAVSPSDWPLGADIELIEPRSPNFAANFFTAEERAQVRAAGLTGRETLVTAVWSGKEAALKAVRLGLRSDTRAVSCHFSGERAAVLSDGQWGGLVKEAGWKAGAAPWRPFAIRWQEPAARAQHPPLRGWWIVRNNHVLTLATATPSKVNSEQKDSVSS
jgi:4'-phosphopantetheinyl transferase